MGLTITTLVVGALGLLTYYLFSWNTRRLFARRHGCELPPKRATCDPLMGIYHRIHDTRAAKAFKSLPAGEALHRQFGATYRESTIFGSSLKTMDSENIRTIFGRNGGDWGVQSYRLPGMRPFCGEGVLTTDGSIWEHSRTMLKPSF